MKKIYCDICGALIPDGETFSPLAEEVTERDGVQTTTYGPPFPAYNACQSVQGLCRACSEAGKSINVEAMVLKEWQRITGAGKKQRRRVRQPEEVEPAPGQSVAEQPQRKEPEASPAAPSNGQSAPSISADKGPSGPGSHWARKKMVHGQLMEYRKRTGLGTLPALAEKAGVSCETLRLMIEAKPVPIEEWRKVGAALDAMGIPRTAENGDGNT